MEERRLDERRSNANVWIIIGVIAVLGAIGLYVLLTQPGDGPTASPTPTVTVTSTAVSTETAPAEPTQATTEATVTETATESASAPATSEAPSPSPVEETSEAAAELPDEDWGEFPPQNYATAPTLGTNIPDTVGEWTADPATSDHHSDGSAVAYGKGDQVLSVRYYNDSFWQWGATVANFGNPAYVGDFVCGTLPAADGLRLSASCLAVTKTGMLQFTQPAAEGGEAPIEALAANATEILGLLAQG